MTEICLTQLKKYKKDALIWVNDDSSSEYDVKWLRQWADVVSTTSNPFLDSHRRCNAAVIGSYYAIKNFASIRKNRRFTHIYHCDNDVFHDKIYMDALCKFWNKYEMPVVLYTEEEHHPIRVPGQAHVPAVEVFEDGFRGHHCQGPSLLFPISKVEEMDKGFLGGGDNGGWDTYVNDILKNFFYPVPALAEQYSVDGVNSANGGLETHFTINPSEYLASYRESITKRISK
jgi:hypothetical protein